MPVTAHTFPILAHILTWLFIICFAVVPSIRSRGPQYQILSPFVAAEKKKSLSWH